MPSVVNDPISADAWRKLHENLRKRKHMLRETGVEEHSLDSALWVASDGLDLEHKDRFFKLAILPYGIVAPMEMLSNLWDEVSGGNVTTNCHQYISFT